MEEEQQQTSTTFGEAWQALRILAARTDLAEDFSGAGSTARYTITTDVFYRFLTFIERAPSIPRGVTLYMEEMADLLQIAAERRKRVL